MFFGNLKYDNKVNRTPSRPSNCKFNNSSNSSPSPFLIPRNSTIDQIKPNQQSLHRNAPYQYITRPSPVQVYTPEFGYHQKTQNSQNFNKTHYHPLANDSSQYSNGSSVLTGQKSGVSTPFTNKQEEQGLMKKGENFQNRNPKTVISTKQNSALNAFPHKLLHNNSYSNLNMNQTDQHKTFNRTLNNVNTNSSENILNNVYNEHRNLSKNPSLVTPTENMTDQKHKYFRETLDLKSQLEKLQQKHSKLKYQYFILESKYDLKNDNGCKNKNESNIETMIRDEKMRGVRNQEETEILKKKIKQLEGQLTKSRVSSKSNEQNQSIVEPYLALSKKKSTTMSADKSNEQNTQLQVDRINQLYSDAKTNQKKLEGQNLELARQCEYLKNELQKYINKRDSHTSNQNCSRTPSCSHQYKMDSSSQDRNNLSISAYTLNTFENTTPDRMGQALQAVEQDRQQLRNKVNVLIEQNQQLKLANKNYQKRVNENYTKTIEKQLQIEGLRDKYHKDITERNNYIQRMSQQYELILVNTHKQLSSKKSNDHEQKWKKNQELVRIQSRNIQELTEEVEKLKENTNSELESINQQNNQLQQLNEELTNRTNSLQQKNRELQIGNIQLKKQLSEIQCTISQLSKLKDTLKGKSQQIHNLNAEFNILQSNKKLVQEQLNQQVANQSNKLKASETLYKQQLQDSQNQIKALVQKLQQCQQQLITFKKEIASLSEHHTKSKQQYEIKLIMKQQQINTTNQLLQNKSDQLVALEQKRQGQRIENKMLNKQLQKEIKRLQECVVIEESKSQQYLEELINKEREYQELLKQSQICIREDIEKKVQAMEEGVENMIEEKVGEGEQNLTISSQVFTIFSNNDHPGDTEKQTQQQLRQQIKTLKQLLKEKDREQLRCSEQYRQSLQEKDHQNQIIEEQLQQLTSQFQQLKLQLQNRQQQIMLMSQSSQRSFKGRKPNKSYSRKKSEISETSLTTSKQLWNSQKLSQKQITSYERLEQLEAAIQSNQQIAEESQKLQGTSKYVEVEEYALVHICGLLGIEAEENNRLSCIIEYLEANQEIYLVTQFYVEVLDLFGIGYSDNMLSSKSSNNLQESINSNRDIYINSQTHQQLLKEIKVFRENISIMIQTNKQLEIYKESLMRDNHRLQKQVKKLEGRLNDNIKDLMINKYENIINEGNEEIIRLRATILYSKYQGSEEQDQETLEQTQNF